MRRDSSSPPIKRRALRAYRRFRLPFPCLGCDGRDPVGGYSVRRRYQRENERLVTELREGTDKLKAQARGADPAGPPPWGVVRDRDRCAVFRRA